MTDTALLYPLLVVMATVTLAAPLLVARLERPYNVFHPLNFVALSLFFGVFGRTLFILMSSSPAVSELLDHRPISTILPGAMLSMFGSILLCLGFLAARTNLIEIKVLTSFVSGYNFRRLVPWLPALFALALAAFYYYQKSTGFEYSGLASLSSKRRVVINDVESSVGYLRFLAQDFPRVILLLLVAQACVAERVTYWMWAGLIGFGSLALAVPFFASSRGGLIFTLIMICTVVNRVRGIRLRTVFVVAAISIAVIFGMLALRRVNTRNVTVMQTLSEVGVEPLFANHTFADVVKLSHIYDAVPGLIPYKYGASFVRIFYAPIPRAIWKGKPEVAMGREITEKIYNRGLKLKKRGGGTPPGLFGESIINFGVYGFPVVVFIAGVSLRLLYNTLEQLAQGSLAGIVLYAGVLPIYSLNMMGGDYTRSLTQSLIITVMTFAFCFVTRVSFVRRRRPSASRR